MKMIRDYIKKLLREEIVPKQEITEERGLSNNVLSVYEQLFDTENLNNSDVLMSFLGYENLKWHTISKLKNIEQFPGIQLWLRFAFVNKNDNPYISKYINIFPVYDGNIGMTATKNEPTLIQIMLDDSMKEYSLKQIKNHPTIKHVIIHEIQHLQTNFVHIKQAWKNDIFSDEFENLKLSKNLINPESEVEHKISNLLYYLSKDELNSVIAQISVSGEKENHTIYKLFSYYKNMSYEQFEKEFIAYNPKLKVDKKLYLKVLDRIKYFFRKADKTFVGYSPDEAS